MLEAIVHDSIQRIEFSDANILINGNEHKLDIVEIQNGKFLHLIYNSHSYFFECLSYDKEAKMFKLGFDGRTYEVFVKDRFDQLLHQLGFDSISKPKVNEVKAPMPGLVLSIKVKVGVEVKKGDSILILEAMKMENNIKSPSDGIVKQILVSEKQAVDKNQSLVQFE